MKSFLRDVNEALHKSNGLINELNDSLAGRDDPINMIASQISYLDQLHQTETSTAIHLNSAYSNLGEYYEALSELSWQNTASSSNTGSLGFRRTLL